MASKLLILYSKSVQYDSSIMKNLVRVGVFAAVLVFAGCRGTISEEPPIHINPNMDFQEKFEPQEVNLFFDDHRSMRPPVAGTISRGSLKEDVALYTGRDAAGAFVASSPVTVDAAFMERGRERYEIFCAVCHGSAGDGQGVIMTGNYGYVQAPDFHVEAIRAQPDGYFFDAITTGIRTMPSYAPQIPVDDRWAIVVYVRALQRSQYAPVADVPPSEQ